MNSLTRRILVPTSAAVLVVGLLAGCSPATHPAVEPITRSAASLQGATVKLPLDTTLNITTGSLSVTSYTAVASDPSIAKFTRGYKTYSAKFNPGITPLKVGETKVVLKNKQGGIQWVTFTVDVVKG
ncbi:MAG TPA: hypothetical protein VHX87_06750 [Galbitalea sp.]|jgi:hypothetical protein|nr:hypothetical protein [Galbitalea sp.]